MNKKGFSLIELLAVIVILAIIASIATPLVLDIINNSKESSLLRSSELVVDGLEQAIIKKMKSNKSFHVDECVFTESKKLNCGVEKISLEIGGELPKAGSVVNFKDGKISSAKLYYDNKLVIKNEDSNFYVGDINNISGTHIALLESQIKSIYGKNINIGDYVEYDETNSGLYGVGKDVKWRVLGIKNGNLLLVSDQNIGTNEANNVVTIKGYYDNSEEKWFNKINEPCKAYEKGKYVVKNSARSISIEDINKITGYNPYAVYKNGVSKIYHYGALTQYGSEVTYTYGTNESGNRVLIYESPNAKGSFEYSEPKEFLLLDGTKLGYEDNSETKTKKSITIKNSYYWYSPEVLTNLDPTDPADVEEYNKTYKIGVKKGTQVYNMLFANTEQYANSYWLQGIYYFNTGYIWNGLYSVGNEKVGYKSALWYLKEYKPNLGVEFEHSDNYRQGVRAVVSLKSNITLTKNDKNTWSIKSKNKEEAQEDLCILLSGTANTKGAKYSCEVKEGTRYNFYVLSTNNDGTTNLIMDRNICEDGTPTDASKEDKCKVAYNSTKDISGVGPVTAMTYLNNATSTWENIPNLNLKYNDEGENFTEFSITGKARMPYYSEISKYDSTNKTNAYLYDYLNLRNNIQTNSISKIYGYWTLSSHIDTSDRAWFVHYYGYITYSYVNNGNDIGVRPVITLKLK